MTSGSTVHLREGEPLVLHCSGNAQRYQDLELTNCARIPGVSIPPEKDEYTLNYTWYCVIIGNTSVGIYDVSTNEEKLFELHIETHSLEQCLADVRATPSPCTAPPQEHTTTSSTIPTSTTTETITTTSNLNPTTSSQMNANVGGSQLNSTDIEDEAIKEYSLYGVVCVLGIIVLVQSTVICLLAVKLCSGRRRGKMEEEGTIVELPKRRNSIQ